MTTEARLRRIIAKILNETNYPTEKGKAVQVLWQDYRNDSAIEQFLDDALRSNATQQERLNAIACLLMAYGVGTIVEGRLQ